MSSKTNISREKLASEFNKICKNIKAEIVVSDIIANTDLSFQDITIQNKSTFKRPYRKDILYVDGRRSDNIEIELSRNGLYDHLPEGLFHIYQTEGSKKLSYSELRKRQKQEERNARQFFTPIENEFFFQKLNIEVAEQELLNDFMSLNEDFLIDFWKLSSKISKKYTLRFLRLLPYCSEISGDIGLTQLALEMIIDEKVTIKKTLTEKVITEQQKGSSKNKLGIDFTLDNLGERYLLPTLDIKIGPTDKKNINKYVRKNDLLNFVHIFCDYVIPIDYEIKINFELKQSHSFKLDKNEPPVLGISSTI